MSDMTRREFLESADKVVSRIMLDAYKELNACGFIAERSKRFSKYVLSLGWLKLGIDITMCGIDCWWTGAMSIRPNTLAYYRWNNNDDHADVIYGLLQGLQLCIERLSSGYDYKFPVRFVWPFSVWSSDDAVVRDVNDKIIPDGLVCDKLSEVSFSEAMESFVVHDEGSMSETLEDVDD